MKCGKICTTNLKFSVSEKAVFTWASKNPLTYKPPLKKKKITCLAIALKQFLFYGKLTCIHLYKCMHYNFFNSTLLRNAMPLPSFTWNGKLIVLSRPFFLWIIFISSKILPITWIQDEVLKHVNHAVNPLALVEHKEGIILLWREILIEFSTCIWNLSFFALCL